MTTLASRSALDGITRLAAIIERLRGPDGCEWDRAQTFATIAPYTIEEAYEVADAIARNDMGNLVDELGDLLLQVIYHSAIAADRGLFDLADVVAAICAKLERRHPRIFAADGAPVDAETAARDWDRIKASEKARQSALDDVPVALPALMRAAKLSNRAAGGGIGLPPTDAKYAPMLDALAAGSTPDASSEIGDLLFAIADFARRRGIDAESALRDANIRFETEFRHAEAQNSKPRL